MSGLGPDMVGFRTAVVLGLVGEARLGLVLAHWWVVPGPGVSGRRAQGCWSWCGLAGVQD